MYNRIATFLLVELPLYAFVASITFETANNHGDLETSTNFTIARMFGYIFAASAILAPHIHFRKIPRPAVLLLVFTVVVFARIAGIPEYMWPSAMDLVGRLFQEAIMVWLICNVIRAFPYTYKRILGVYAFAAITIAILQILSVTSTETSQAGRVTMFADDPNTACGKFGLAAVICVVTLLSSRSRVWLRAIAGLALIPLTLTMVGTGSRGGLLAFLIGSMVACAPLLFEGSTPARIGRFVMIVAVFSGLAAAVLTNETALDRINEARGGDLALRESIYPADFIVVTNHPFFGAGPIQNYDEVGDEASTILSSNSTENTFLWSLTAVGIIGSAPFFAAVGAALIAAWRARKTSLGWMPLAFLSCALAFSCTIEWHGQKPLWLALAMAYSSIYAATSRVATISHGATAVPVSFAAPSALSSRFPA